MAVQRLLSQETIHLLCASLEVHEPCIILDKLLYCSLQCGSAWVRVTVRQADCSLVLEDDGIGAATDEIESLESSSREDSIFLLLQNQLSENFGNVVRLLSSICDITVVSRKQHQDSSRYIQIKGGQIIQTKSVPHYLRYGNKIHLTSLFYSLPVRQQWLKENQKHLYHMVHSSILKFAAMFPKCDFELHTQSSSISAALFRIFRRTGSWKSRLKELWGADITSHLVPLHLESNHENEKWMARGFFSIQKSTRISKEYSQILFLNDKPCYLNLRNEISNILSKISEEQLQVATKSDKTQPGEPIFYIHLYMQKDRIFSYLPEYVEAQILRVLRETFYASLLDDKSNLQKTTLQWKVPTPPKIRENFQLLPQKLYSPRLPNPNLPKLSVKKISQVMKNLQQFVSSPSVYTPIGRGALKLGESNSIHHISTPVLRDIFDKMQWKGVWNRSFLLFWADKTLYAMDQHAADERVQYENLQHQLLEQVNNGSIPTTVLKESQIYLRLSVEEYEYAYRYKEILRQWGWTLTFDSHSPFETSPQVQILEMPCIAEMPTIHLDVLREQIQSIIDTKSPNVILQEIPQGFLQQLATRACQKAIKFGDSLTRQRINQLIEQLKTCKYPFQCAHGRPSAVPLFRVSK